MAKRTDFRWSLGAFQGAGGGLRKVEDGNAWEEIEIILEHHEAYN